jgi:hypothetical protein
MNVSSSTVRMWLSLLRTQLTELKEPQCQFSSNFVYLVSLFTQLAQNSLRLFVPPTNHLSSIHSDPTSHFHHPPIDSLVSHPVDLALQVGRVPLLHRQVRGDDRVEAGPWTQHTALHCTTLHCTALHCTAWPSLTPDQTCGFLPRIVRGGGSCEVEPGQGGQVEQHQHIGQHGSAAHTLHCTALHCTTLHCRYSLDTGIFTQLIQVLTRICPVSCILYPPIPSVCYCPRTGQQAMEKDWDTI